MINLSFSDLTLAEIASVIFENEKLEISAETEARIEESFHFLREFSQGKIIYGINTGFGPMAQVKINAEDQIQLQYNLIRSHASGMGSPLSANEVRASMIARLNSLSLGYSGIHISAVKVLQEMINHRIIPIIFSHGGVGASGDLVQLAHLALAMIGEGNVEYQGEVINTTSAFAKAGITPMHITLREGLAIMNGTSVMTGIGLVNSIYAQRAVEWSAMASAMICELISAFDDYFSTELNSSKKHLGQQRIAGAMRKVLEGSQFSRKREKQLYAENLQHDVMENKVQEYYSIRCVPQILGPILDAVDGCTAILMEEINSANDNPIVHVASKNVYHGGNFHGDYVAFEMDKLKIAITKLSVLAERQLNFLMNPALNGVLPPFVNLGRQGFNFGSQGMQFTATSSTAENQMLANPMYVHSIPNNNDNQDVVSMGANAAQAATRVIENAFEVLAIEMVAIVQAVDFLGRSAGLAPSSVLAYRKIRACVPVFSDDEPMYGKLAALKEFLKKTSPLKIEELK